MHTGQHFDDNMSSIFFDQLAIPRPAYSLGINGGNHGEMTGRMLAEIEQVILKEQPALVLVYGDTNSTLAGALAAAKLHVPVAHVEAGLRSFNMRMPEEINRILTNQLSEWLFCPTAAAIANLKKEGFAEKHVTLCLVGDVMQDAALLFAPFACAPDGMGGEVFALATLHRAENTDDPRRLAALVQALNRVHDEVAPVVLPLHPRTRRAIERNGLALQVNTIDPVGYLQMLWLLQHCGLVMTDSGGVQKEAFFHGKACLTLRDETEWVELVDMGANQLVGADAERITEQANAWFETSINCDPGLYGGGQAAERIADQLAHLTR
ncbi:non-hydrolyzing UDP-N-acetylglucosamine 2-epimerase [Motiliproteus sp. SC1-56]|uniref:non-hydrolyzing UDP-N-acetylglucosamine 2-epimerase n=1 Tax=Motiliproteus sp. SC1-56 TaxID=2799565 RepID=UPI00351CB60C